MTTNPVMKYEYYLLGNSVPIRVVFDEEHRRIGAEVPANETRDLSKDATYLSRLDNSFEVEAITLEQFDRHCERVWDARGLKA